MVFTSREFLLFFVVACAAYFFLPHRWRWVVLLIASYTFYTSGESVYVLLLLSVTLAAYVAAIAIEKVASPAPRRGLLIVSLIVLFLPLGIFKYLEFVVQSAANASSWMGYLWAAPHFDLFLPLGISFFTFQAAGYVIDVYAGRIRTERNPGVFALYVSFFPQLIAGPIERAHRLLPQLRKHVRFDPERTTSGLRLILWGVFKKLVIADSLAVYVDRVYGAPTEYQGLPLLIATIFFAFQIYCDFSAYVDIARGTARILGIDLMRNFDRPYGAASIGEFWHRWHISLSTWFRDYVYVPLGGNRYGISVQSRNILVVFLLSGLWHGAGWTFVIWGGLHGLYLVTSIWTAGLREKLNQRTGLSNLPLLHRTLQVATTFGLVTLAWVFFRAASVDDAMYVLVHMFQGVPAQVMDGGAVAQLVADANATMLGFWALLAFIAMMLGSHIVSAETLRAMVERTALWQRWAGYYTALAGILFFSAIDTDAFIYFRF